MRKNLLAAPKIIVGALVLFAIGVMLTGVFLRYVMVEITDYLDMDPINFFWVEEVGELTLTWLTLVGAAVGIAERSHFTLTLLTHRFPPGVQRSINVFNHLLIAAFGGVLAWLGWQLVVLNGGLASPALEISLGWLYASAVVGGILIVLYALGTAARPLEPTLAEVRE
ncbi:MAG: TRAP transporter small permease [Alphaproteobacteria bacterium]|nr:TRAP transporter small permease [Alphaproteobacteria bacterium]